MRKSKFSENQIISLLKEVEKGRAVKDVCREHSVLMVTDAADGNHFAEWAWRPTPLFFRLRRQFLCQPNPAHRNSDPQQRRR